MNYLVQRIYIALSHFVQPRLSIPSLPRSSPAPAPGIAVITALRIYYVYLFGVFMSDTVDIIMEGPFGKIRVNIRFEYNNHNGRNSEIIRRGDVLVVTHTSSLL